MNLDVLGWPKKCHSLRDDFLTFSQGTVATHLRCGGIFSDNVITNFLLVLTVKEF